MLVLEEVRMAKGRKEERQALAEMMNPVLEKRESGC